MKVKSYKIDEVEEKKDKTSYLLEMRIEFKQKKDRDDFLRMVKDNLR